MVNIWFETLVIILAIMLALFLFLAIILMYKLLQITKQVQRITEYAEETVEKAEEVADFFRKTATPVAILKLIANISEKFSEVAGAFKRSGKSRKRK